MANDRDYDRDDRPSRYRGSGESARSETSILGIIALVIGIKALLISVVPCFGALAIFAAGFALILAVASVLIARGGRQGMGLPVAATVVSSLAVAFSLVWVAMFSAMFGLSADHAASRPVQPPPPQFVQPQPFPAKKIEPANDEQFEKQLLEDLAKDRVKEAIRNGPGLPVTAAELAEEYRTNAVAAEAKYDGQVLAVTGKVVRVVRVNGSPTYTLELEADKGVIACGFSAQTKHPLGALARGQTATVRGQCAGRTGETITLKDCVLVK